MNIGGLTKTGRARLAAALAALVALTGATTAVAEAPFRLPQPLVDRAGAFGGNAGEVRDAQERLQNEDRVQLWVVMVETFQGVDRQTWADTTADRSGLGRDDPLLAVAVQDREYAWSVTQDFPLTDDQLADIASREVEPRLADGDWAGAAAAMADGLRDDIGGGSGGGGAGTGFLVLIFVVAAVGVGLFVFMRSRRKQAPRAQAGGPAAAADGPKDEYDALSTADLEKRANVLLVETDDAIKTSTQELGFAQASFGDEAAAPFAKALQEAQAELTGAFQVRREVETAEGMDEATRRAKLLEVCRRADAASDRLDAEAEAFDRLRELEKNAGRVIEDLGRRLDAIEGRLPAADAVLAELTGSYSPGAVAAVADNLAQARDRVAFARTEVTEGTAEVAAGDAGKAAVSARAAEEAVGQAEQLIGAVERARTDLAEAQARITQAMADTERDVAEAQSLDQDGSSAAAVAAARAALQEAAAAASPQGGADPIGALRRLEEADRALDDALAGERDEAAKRDRSAQQLQSALLAARASIDAAHDFITTRRGAVGSEARTQLAEAQRHIEYAASIADTDPATALKHASAADSLADQALQYARAEAGRPDPGQWGGMGGGLGGAIGGALGGGGGGGGGFGGLAGAILGGILVNSGLGGMGGGGFGRGGGGGGGIGRMPSRGGAAPGSFGGRATRGRRGGGGRF